MLLCNFPDWGSNESSFRENQLIVIVAFSLSYYVNKTKILPVQEVSFHRVEFIIKEELLYTCIEYKTLDTYSQVRHNLRS